MITKSQAIDAILKSGYRLSIDYKDQLYFEKSEHPTIALNSKTFTVFNHIIPAFAISPATGKSCYACEYLLEDCDLTAWGMLSLPDPCSTYWC